MKTTAFKEELLSLRSHTFITITENEQFCDLPTPSIRKNKQQIYYLETKKSTNTWRPLTHLPCGRMVPKCAFDSQFFSTFSGSSFYVRKKRMKYCRNNNWWWWQWTTTHIYLELSKRFQTIRRLLQHFHIFSFSQFHVLQFCLSENE